MCSFNQVHACALHLGFKRLVCLSMFDAFTNTVHMIDSKLKIFEKSFYPTDLEIFN